MNLNANIRHKIDISVSLIFVVCLIYANIGCDANNKTNEQTISENIIERVEVLKTSRYSSSVLEISIAPLDKQGHLVSIGVLVDIELWDNSAKNTLIQRWDDQNLKTDSFEEYVGYILRLKYKNFKPTGGQMAYIQITLNQEETNINSDAEILLFPNNEC
jgi:hypothetical protein